MVHRICDRPGPFKELSGGEPLFVEGLVITAAHLMIVRQERPPDAHSTHTGVEPTDNSGLYIDATLLIKSITSCVPILFFSVNVLMRMQQ